MTKLFSYTLFRIPIFLLIVFSINGLTAQKLDHRLGIITVQLESSANIENLVKSNRYFEGIETEIQIEKLVSKPFSVWNLSFNQNRINENDFLGRLRQSLLVSNAQFDFWLEERSPPNDPFYVFQYYFNNFGQNGGTIGVDVDAEDAWETTTGGVTIYGDTIVLCIIDEGFERTHYDLQANSWVNHDEIQNNNIDDDGNGYIDDYYGWNVIYENDDVAFEDQIHGTNVAGIAGAVGNNNTGITGLNWNVKLMYVTRGYSNSDAVAAYSYPFELRKKYNESFGSEGAFVVATNSSWGVNYGMPGDAPMWCAIYDSLGSVGILSAAATANIDVNVDEEGDLPTSCTSDFLVTTTKLDNKDSLPPNAGYGLESIDLAAFGKNVFSTSTNNGYNSFSGTSAAAPQIAGTIALLYSAPCASFMELTKNQPADASILVKNYILNGTVPVDVLQGKTVAGGRLNAANSLELLMNDCNYSGCYPPYSIVIDGIAQESASINWLLGLNSTGVQLRYREIGQSTWNEINNIINPYEITGLESCTNYEFQLASVCGLEASNYSLSYEFQTIGCCIPPSMFETQYVENDQVLLQWEATPAAISYQLRYREVDSLTWNYLETDDFELLIQDLNSCTAYEFQIKSICSSNQSSDFSQSLFATLMGCSNCIELPYCASSANAMSFMWLSEVVFANLENNSNNSIEGYSDHTGYSADIFQGQSYEISLVSDGDFGPLPGIFNVWIDYDQNGEFDDLSELILHSSLETSSSKIITVPTNANIGSTRMRVSFMDQDSESCGTQNLNGEVEDYCINIDEPTECLPPINIVYETFENSIEISWLGNLFIQSYLIKYREVVDTTWVYVLCQANEFSLNNLIPCTDYEFEIQSICDGEPSTPSPIHFFTTKGCGACLDNIYCEENSAKADFEWIESVQLNTLSNISGSNDGFCYFQDHTTNLIKEQVYPLVIKPGFASGTFEEYYMVWIDFNHDGIFDENEVVYNSFFPITGHVQSFITIPDSAQIGSTRMRVLMKYNGAPDSPCDYDFFGEIEEYCINIVENDNSVCDTPETIEVTSSPNNATTVSANWANIANAISYTLRYKKSYGSGPWKYITTNDNSCNLYQLEECETYQIQVKTICELGLSEFSNPFEFQAGCIVNTQETKSLNSINVFPNPTRNDFFINYYLSTQTKVSFELFDVTGKLLKVKTLPAAFGEQQIELAFPNGCTDGIYYLKFKPDGQNPSILKIVKTH